MSQRSRKNIQDRPDRTEVTLGSFRIYRPGEGNVTQQIEFEVALDQAVDRRSLPADVIRSTARN